MQHDVQRDSRGHAMISRACDSAVLASDGAASGKGGLIMMCGKPGWEPAGAMLAGSGSTYDTPAVRRPVAACKHWTHA